MALFKRNGNDIDTSFIFDFDYDEPTRGYLKKMALETVIAFIAKSVSMSEFRYIRDQKRVHDDLHYMLNVRPNTDQSASNFWFDYTYRLINEGEALGIVTETNDLLIADSFVRNEFAVYADTFSDVTVKGYVFKKSFKMDEVVYLKFGNERLSKFMDGMFQDYTALFNRLIETNLRSNQLRATVNIEANQSLDANRQKQLQDFINNMYRSFRDKAIAIVPKLRGFEYNEISDGNTSSQSIEEITKLKTSLVDEVADILSVPQKLLHGDSATDIDTLMRAYIKFCIDPINKMIADELNTKFIKKSDYLKGDRIKVIGIQAVSAIQNAESVDKLVASGAYSRNEVRIMLGDEPADDPQLDEYVLTKNYETVNSTKGGDTNANEETV